MCNKKYKNFKNLHKKRKALPVGGKVCHTHYFYPIHMLNFSMNTIFQQTSEASCGLLITISEF